MNCYSGWSWALRGGLPFRNDLLAGTFPMADIDDLSDPNDGQAGNCKAQPPGKPVPQQQNQGSYQAATSNDR